MDLYIETNMHLSILFSPPPPPPFQVTFAIFPQDHFIMTPPVYDNLEKYPPPAYYSPYYN